MGKNSKPFHIVTAGPVSIPIYKTSKGYCCKYPERIDRVNFRELRDEVQIIANKIANGIPLDDEESLRRELEYFRELEKKLDGIPLRTAVESFLASNPSQKLTPAKLGDVVTGYHAAIVKKSGRQTRWHGTLKTYLGKLAPLAHREIHTITTEQLLLLIDEIDGGGTYKNNVLTTIKSLFTHARDTMKALPRELRTEADMIKPVHEKTAKYPLYTPEEMEKLLRVETDNALLKQVKDVICLAGFCGLRMSEGHGEETEHAPLQAEQMFFAHNNILLGEEEQKDGTRGNRYAPLLPNAKKWLAHLDGKTGSVWTGKKFNDRFKQLAAAAGVTLRENMLRKSFITYRTAIIKDAGRVALEAGTSAETIRKYYLRPELEPVAHAWFGIFPTR